MDLTKQHCVPCEGGVEPLKGEELENYVTYLNSEWKIEGEGDPFDGKGKTLKRKFKFKDFKEAMVFVNKIAEVAESEGHHPDIQISYSKVDIELTTHAIKGLSPNDFILASKIDALLKEE